LISNNKVDKEPRLLNKHEKTNEGFAHEESKISRIVVGVLRLSRCRLSENKMNGVFVKNLYQKTLEI
jgi:hypothetical protein